MLCPTFGPVLVERYGRVLTRIVREAAARYGYAAWRGATARNRKVYGRSMRRKRYVPLNRPFASARRARNVTLRGLRTWIVTSAPFWPGPPSSLPLTRIERPLWTVRGLILKLTPALTFWVSVLLAAAFGSVSNAR